MIFLKKHKLNIKKTFLVFVFAAVFIFSFFPMPASAQWQTLASILLALPGILLALWGFFTNLFAQLGVVVFNWVTGPTFISWGYTQNPVVEMGLGITKQFVNMGLVVVLIFIALAIALRLQEYASQKTLIRLIAVALLVNFAPVICGLIVDAANIIMNYFLAAIKEGVDSILGGLKNSFGIFLEMMKLRTPVETKLSLFGQLGVDAILNAVIGFTFILLAVIFLVRYLAIWILVILAPLAFVAWILPSTKKFWDQWWQQFIQWSIIGIPLAFFVYLAINSLVVMNLEFANKIPAVSVTEDMSAAVRSFNEFFGYMMVVIMLWLGIVIGLSTSARGATGIMDFAKTKGKAGAKWAAKAIPTGTATATVGAFRGLGKGAKEGKGLGRITGAAVGAFKGAATYEGREKGKEVLGKALEKAHLVRPGAYEAARRKRWKIEEEVKRLDTLPTDRLHEIAQKKVLTPADRKSTIAAFEVLAKRSALGDKEKDLLPKMQSFGADTKQALKARPDWASLVGKKTSEVVAGASTRDFTKNTQAEALKNIDVFISLDAPKIQNIGLHGSAEQKSALREATTPGSTTWKDLVELADRLIKEGNKKEYEKLDGIAKEILRNPNFRQ